MNDEKVFKRINFFRGFLTTEEDWNAAEAYHVKKRQLHNKLLHAPGVVPHFLGGLRVAARRREPFSIEVSSGYAIDGAGNDILLPEPAIISINPPDYKLPQNLYIVIKYYEELADFITYKENVEYKGHRRIAEKAKIDVIITEPDINQEVEIARIYLEKGVKRITDARNPLEPKANEIDLRYVPIAGVAGSFITPKIMYDLLDLLVYKRDIYGYMGHRLKVTTALDVLHIIYTFHMLIFTGFVDMRNVFYLFSLLFDSQWDMVLDVESNFPDISSRKEFATFKKNLEILRGMYLDRKFTYEFLINIYTYQKKGAEALRALFEKELKPKIVLKKEAEIPSEILWEKIKTRSEEFTDVLVFEGKEFKLVDFIDLLNEESEKLHKFSIRDEKDRYRSRQRQKYPDGVLLEDVGVHYEGGYAEWEVRGVEPNKDLIMITRIDYVRGDYECEMYINAKRISNLVCPGNDMKFRWRNWPYVIPAEYVTDTSLRIKQVPITADRDVNMFKIWFYQPV